MKALFRRLQRIETQLAPKPNLASQRAAELLRERRLRRLEAGGEHFQEHPTPVLMGPGRRLSVTETLRLRRRLAQERICQRHGRAEIATDIRS